MQTVPNAANSKAGKKTGPVFFKAAFAVSGAAMTLLFSSGGSLLFIGAGVVLSLAICAVLAFRFRLIERLLPNVKILPVITAAVLTVYICYEYALLFTRSTNALITGYLLRSPLSAVSGAAASALPALVAVAASLTLFLWLWWLTNGAFRFFARWVRESDRTERIFLPVAFALLFAAVAATYLSTTAFTATAVDYDVVYTADSSQLVKSNAFFYISAYENDIRQPLFAVFSMPFAAAAMLVSKMLFFVPNAYVIALGAVQVFLLLFGFTLLARTLELRGAEKALFLCLLACSYPALLFSFAIEQYVFALFWVLLLVYAWREKAKERLFPFAAASGSLLTSAAFFPLLLEKDGWKQNIRRILLAAFSVLAFFILFGRVPLLNSTIDKLKDIASFSGGSLAVRERLLQYLNFAAACFVRPVAAVDFNTFSHVSFQLAPADSVNIPGIAVLVASAAGAAFGFRKPVVRLSACWAAFSVLLLFIVGWGTSENGLVLYTLYFSWAFFILVFELVSRLFQQSRAARIALLTVCLAALVLFNVQGMRDLLRFALQYYPAL